jgi:TonB family protein
MKRLLSFELVVWLICCASLVAERNGPLGKQDQARAPSSRGSPPLTNAPVVPTSSAEQAIPAAHLIKVCSAKNPPPCATAPHAVFAPDPEYSEEARKAHYQGKCSLRMVVGTDGRVHDLRVYRALGHGLDEKAIEAVEQWQFDPATMEGKPVAVEINVEVAFHLYSGPPLVVSPNTARMTVGTRQQFSVSALSAAKRGVNWSVSGAGCAVSSCGSISAKGLYTAPPSAPNPPTVVVTAVSATDQAKRGWAFITIESSPVSK